MSADEQTKLGFQAGEGGKATCFETKLLPGVNQFELLCPHPVETIESLFQLFLSFHISSCLFVAAGSLIYLVLVSSQYELSFAWVTFCPEGTGPSNECVDHDSIEML